LKPTGGLLQAILAIVHAQTATVIPANEGAAHLGEYATVEGVVGEGLHIKDRQHLSKHRRGLPQSDIQGLDTVRFTNLEIATAIRH